MSKTLRFASTLIVLILISTGVYATDEKNTLYPVMEENGKWGFIDKEGNVVIAAAFDYARPFSEGIAAVRKDYRIIIDKKDKSFDPTPPFDLKVFCTIHAEAFGPPENNLYSFWGFIDKTGEIIVEPLYIKVDDFHDGWAQIWVHVLAYGHQIFPGLSQSKVNVEEISLGGYYVSKSGNEYLYDPEGSTKLIIAPYMSFLAGSDRDLVPDKKEYYGAKTFSDGLAAVCRFREGKGNNIRGWGYIDTMGEIVINAEYGDAESFSDGLAAVRKGGVLTGLGKAGYIDTEGKVTIDFQFKEAGPFRDGLAIVKLTTGIKFGESIEVYSLINKEGNIVAELSFEEVRDFQEGLAVVKHEEKYGYINGQGKISVRPKFDEAYAFCEDYGRVRIGDKWGYINKRGHQVIDTQYEEAEDFNEGFAIVKSNGKYGYIDTSGEMITEVVFDEAASFYGELAAVWIGGKMGYIDKTGEYVWQAGMN